ncbi:hypothetical protein HYR69_00170 [Candidatus Sumerlaeota bacterium]|nr:hypothetical protein [Candidatus Sumerlaeota bacterium]
MFRFFFSGLCAGLDGAEAESRENLREIFYSKSRLVRYNAGFKSLRGTCGCPIFRDPKGDKPPTERNFQK